MNTGGGKRCVDAGISIGLVRVHGFRVRGNAAPRNDNRSTDPRAGENQDLRSNPYNNSILCEKSSAITAAEQRDNSKKTAARNGEQRRAPQAELDVGVAENPVMRSILERARGYQEQKENNLRKGLPGSRQAGSLARSLAVNCARTSDCRVLPQF
jgi:hypothetical protein